MHSRIFCSAATSTFELTWLRLSITRRSGSRFNFSDSSIVVPAAKTHCAIFFSELRDVDAKRPVNCAALDVESRSSRRRRHPDQVVAVVIFKMIDMSSYVVLMMNDFCSLPDCARAWRWLAVVRCAGCAVYFTYIPCLCMRQVVGRYESPMHVVIEAITS